MELISQTEWLKKQYALFKEIEAYRIQVEIRNYRAQQLRELLSDLASVSLDRFNEEVWPLGQAIVNNQKIDVFNEDTIKAHINEVKSALMNRTLIYKGNSIWGSGSSVYGANLNLSVEEKTKLILKALNILKEDSLTPQEKVEKIQQIKGFGANIASGLVMVFHPDSYMLYNEVSKKTAKLLGINEEVYQKEMGILLSELDTKNFIELDYFIYRLLDLQAYNNESLGETFNEIFLFKDATEFSFKLMKLFCEELEIRDHQDKRLALTITKRFKNETAIHYNFCNWLILGFYPGGKVRVPLLVDDANQLDVKELFSFAQQPDEPK